MELIEVLKAAKRHLATEPVPESWGGTTKYICFAIAVAYREKCGDSAWKDYEEARNYVLNELQDLQGSLGTVNSACFSENLAIAYLKALGVKPETACLQQARHLWLDQLIKELN